MTARVERKKNKNDTIERVLANPKDGRLCIGIRLRFMDKYHAQPLANMEGYSLFLEPHDCDAYAIDNGSGFWVVITIDNFRAVGIEDWGPL